MYLFLKIKIKVYAVYIYQKSKFQNCKLSKITIPVLALYNLQKYWIEKN